MIYSLLRSNECAGVAQLVEQLICNQQVGGSSPSTSSILIYGSIPERPKGADCKSVVNDFGGSNPPSPTKQIRTCESKSLFVCVCVRRTQHRFATLVANIISSVTRTSLFVKRTQNEVATSRKQCYASHKQCCLRQTMLHFVQTEFQTNPLLLFRQKPLKILRFSMVFYFIFKTVICHFQTENSLFPTIQKSSSDKCINQKNYILLLIFR